MIEYKIYFIINKLLPNINQKIFYEILHTTENFLFQFDLYINILTQIHPNTKTF